MATEWTPDTWCACPTCNGPSFPVDPAGEPVSPRELLCHSCDHRWEGTAKQVRTARAMWRHRYGEDLELGAVDGPARLRWWMEQVSAWKTRLADERAKYQRALEGRW